MSLFSGSIWPEFLRNFFMLDVHRNKGDYEKITLDGTVVKNMLLDDEKKIDSSSEKMM